MRRVLKALAAFLLCSGHLLSAHAQSDYFTALEQELSDSYGLTGGTWMFPADEAGVLQEMRGTSGVSTTLTDVAGQPFTRALQVSNTARANNPWDHKVETFNDVVIEQGGSALLIIWIRSVSAEIGTGFVTLQFEEAGPPFDKSLDEGLLPAGTWQRLLIPWTARERFTAGQGRFQITFGNLRQTYEIGGLAMRYYGSTYTLDQLPHTDHNNTYDGRDLSAAWRAGADARIEMHRKANLEVEVVDGAGTVVPGATVHIDMQQHAFGFGTAVAVGRLLSSTPDGEWYRNQLENLNGDGKTFSMVVMENAHKWTSWENPLFEGTQDEVAEAVQWFRDRDIAVRGHTLVWPGWQYLPADMQANQGDVSYLQNRITDHLNDILTYPGIQGELVDWDVVNEPTHEQDLENALGGTDVYAGWFNLAAALAPEARLYINEYSILSQSGLDVGTQAAYKALIQQILDDGGRIDGIGLQGHVNPPFASPEAVLAILDDFATLGPELAVTEYDASGVEEQLAADYLRDFMTVVFSHPAATRFMMWGFWDENHWFDDAPIYRSDKTLKPSGEAFLDLVFNQWWTGEMVTTDAFGLGDVRGFKGTYNFLAAADGFENTERTAVLTADSSFTLTLSLVGTVAPPAPGSLTAEVSDAHDGIVLAWQDRSQGETGFVIERAAGDGAFAPIDTVSTDVTTYADLGLALGSYTYRVYAVNAIGASAATSTATVLVTQGGVGPTYGNGGTPGTGAPWFIARDGVIRIEAEDYNQGGPGIAYFDTDAVNNGGAYRDDQVDVEPAADEGGGFNVGWVELNEWLNYTVDVEAADQYDIRIRVARDPVDQSSLRILFGPDVNTLQDLTGTIAVPSTGGWQTWTTLTVPAVALDAGVQVMRVEMLGPLFNMNWIEVDGAMVTGVEGDEPVAYGLQPPYPNPFTTQATVRFAVEATQQVRVVVYDVLGRAVLVAHDGLARGGQAYAVQLDGHGLASGWYMVRLEGEAMTATRQVLRVR